MEREILPAYTEIPDVGLYLEQTSNYLNRYLEPLDIKVTNSMLSNYVKKHIITSPEKKQYSRQQICYLFFITLTKSVMSLDELKLAVAMQQSSYETEVAYNYFRAELKKVVGHVFEGTNLPPLDCQKAHPNKIFLRNTILATVYQVYIKRYLHEANLLTETN
ncbi:DUF1836 domain-containing protein [Ligilactobacillus equi]|uniref:DUF1836 domain-containing protein n=1 Tax=Ligilactobacillus equi TaxID=137357 RepID=UPI002ED6AF26